MENTVKRPNRHSNPSNFAKRLKNLSGRRKYIRGKNRAVREVMKELP